ncbi:phage integrase central domain-containing protein [Parasutterella sp.]|uniref:phage integrase central domain-containing protein n=1 Tax=Parasutterella sp. TaxID=2049037 RepID=UPI003AF15670
MSHAKIGRFTKKQIFELPDGTHRLEPHLYIRVRSNGRYRNYFFRFLDPKGRVCDLALGSASKKPLSEVKQFAFLLKTSLQFSGKASALLEAKQHRVHFKDYAERVIEILASVRLWKNPAQKQSWSSSISTYAFPVIGEKFIDEIDRKDILKILRPIWISKTITASRVRGRLEKIFAYAINENLFIGNNPASWKGNLDLWNLCTKGG